MATFQLGKKIRSPYSFHHGNSHGAVDWWDGSPHRFALCLYESALLRPIPWSPARVRDNLQNRLIESTGGQNLVWPLLGVSVDFTTAPKGARMELHFFEGKRPKIWDQTSPPLPRGWRKGNTFLVLTSPYPSGVPDFMNAEMKCYSTPDGHPMQVATFLERTPITTIQVGIMEDRCRAKVILPPG
jgi:hypothetical protein